jgi:hypothetical protein
VFVPLTALWLVLTAQQMLKNGQPVCPAHLMPASLKERGEMGMGFSQTATTHHFLLTSDGGAIVVEANDPKDKESRDNIRMHLHHIQHAFQNGDFNIPMFVHDTVPPGVAVMKQRAKRIHYSIQETPNGGRVVIRTTDKAAVDAIHRFLQFQIFEHKTGDPLN